MDLHRSHGPGVARFLGTWEREASRESEHSSLSHCGGMVVAGSRGGNGLDKKTNLSGPWFL